MSARHFLTISDHSVDDLAEIFTVAERLKKSQAIGQLHRHCEGKTLAMIFEKPSNRTRLSFETGMFQLGGYAINVPAADIQMGIRETVEDVSRVFSRYHDVVMIRSNYHTDIETFASHSSIPVINGLSDKAHPCQAMADLLTIKEHKGELKGLKLVFVGDGNNVSYSLKAACDVFGIEFVHTCPDGYEFENERSNYVVVRDPFEAVFGADVVYTDVWTSMGQEEERQKRLREFDGYTVSMDMLMKAKEDAIFLHCLPAHRGEEVTGDVIESGQSVVFDQAENRLHAQKGILTWLMGAI